jgi:FkbM family methyltransferase
MYGNSLHDAALYKEILEGKYEKRTVELVKNLLGEGMAFVDIGAHIGFYTLLAARLVGSKGKVYAFEPDPSNSTSLRNNVELNGCNNVILVPKAISDRSGTAKLNLGKYSETNSLYVPVWPTDRSVMVETISLDEFWDSVETKIGPLTIGLLKIDVEGAEPFVLDGMKKILERGACRHIIIEFNPQCLRGAAIDPSSFLKRLFILFKNVYLIDDDAGLVSLDAQNHSGFNRDYVNLYVTNTI